MGRVKEGKGGKGRGKEGEKKGERKYATMIRGEHTLIFQKLSKEFCGEGGAFVLKMIQNATRHL